ncbi:NAD(P)/FAD-dependent oxidoreductase [Chitinivorax sp. B]|uniref:FAD-dependent oxidoreductase n=1 Tax=Chitinivorax sp. B TaxID=2502235 RepID=UPI001485B56F|nr:NAD(P)/FAD-dependent oxidoreductase [Chitinivorax sp. B]
MQPLNIVVIGAGIAGLTLAKGLQKQGIPCHILEKDSHALARRQGFRIRLNASGQAALAACLPVADFDQVVSEVALSQERMCLFDGQLRPVKQRIMAWQGDAEPVAFQPPEWKVDRSMLRATLLRGLESHIAFSSPYRAMHPQPDGRWAVHAGNRTLLADVVVVADGAHSDVAAQLGLHTEREREYACIYARCWSASPAWHRFYADDLSVIRADGLTMIIDAMTFSSNIDRAGYLYWAIFARHAHPLMTRARHQPQRVGGVAAQWAAEANWHGDLQALLAAQEGQASVVDVVQLARPIVGPAGVVFMGDAAHLMSPASGLGANTALYDAHCLTELFALVQQGRLSLRTALDAYTDRMSTHASCCLWQSLNGSRELTLESSHSVE